MPTIEPKGNEEKIIDVLAKQISDEATELKKQIVAIEADNVAEFKQKLAEYIKNI